jgi:8-oxo-dGTP diphosphatase
MPTPVLLTVDAVVFGYTPDRDLHVLLIRRGLEPYAGSWALPGGFVLPNEHLETAVRRELREEAGIEPDYLEQLYTFGDPARDPRGHVVSVAYYALVKPTKFTLAAGTDADDAQWKPMADLPPLAFDHAEILQTAFKRLSAKATYEPVGFELLDEKFPFSHLEHLYRTFLGHDIERRNFRKKIMQYGFVEELDEKAGSSGSGRPATLFRFNRARYFELKNQGIVLDLFVKEPPVKK